MTERPAHPWLLCVAEDVRCAQTMLSAQIFAAEVGPEASNLLHIMIALLSSQHLIFTYIFYYNN